jgi:hypothetical protein
MMKKAKSSRADQLPATTLFPLFRKTAPPASVALASFVDSAEHRLSSISS